MERETLEGLVKYSQTSCYLCSEWLDDSVVEEHLLSCSQQTIVCPNRCGVLVARKYLHLHLNTCRASYGGTDKMDGNKGFFAVPEDNDGQLGAMDIIAYVENNIRSLRMAIADANLKFYRLFEQQDELIRCCNSTNQMGSKIYDMILTSQTRQLIEKKQLKDEVAAMQDKILILQKRFSDGEANKPNESANNATLEISELKTRIQYLEDQNDTYRRQLDCCAQRFSSLQNQIVELNVRHPMPSNGHTIWRIFNFAKAFADSKESNVILKGPVFTNAPYGYKLQLTANLNGHGYFRGNSITIHLVVYSGPYDNLLKWPCRINAKITLIGQCGPSRTREVELTKSQHSNKAERFVAIPHKVVLSPTHLQNDTIFVEVKATDETNRG
uniref:TRAF-type domain-containing protein n=1 Tax=Anopheles funestus TaxID=62324 RepID=A0A182RHM2_ANOFN